MLDIAHACLTVYVHMSLWVHCSVGCYRLTQNRQSSPSDKTHIVTLIFVSFLSPQPDTSLHCQSTVCLFIPRLSLVLNILLQRDGQVELTRRLCNLVQWIRWVENMIISQTMSMHIWRVGIDLSRHPLILDLLSTCPTVSSIHGSKLVSSPSLFLRSFSLFLSDRRNSRLCRVIEVFGDVNFGKVRRSLLTYLYLRILSAGVHAGRQVSAEDGRRR